MESSLNNFSCFLFLLSTFQHEEVQFLEIELENQKQKYDELASFTKSLLAAVRSNDHERQQVRSRKNKKTHRLPSADISHLPSFCVCVFFSRSSWPVYLSLPTRTGT